MKKLALTILSLLMGATSALMAQNGVNPLAVHYNGGEGYPAWSREIRWGNTIDMSAYTNGTTEFEKFENARDQLYAQGGGVLYYPAGVYNFDIPHRGPNGRGLMLKKGVVIVGDRPTFQPNAVVTRAQHPDSIRVHGLTSMPTRFVFTDSIITTPSGGTGTVPFAWNMIGFMKGANETNLGEVSHVGIAWVELEKGYIYFGFGRDSAYASSWGESTCWQGGTSLVQGVPTPNNKIVNGWRDRVPNGTHPMDAFVGCQQVGYGNAILPSKILVFGVKLTNSLCPNYMLDPTGTIGNGFIEPSGWRFGARMGIHGKHVFVANNVIDKPTASFVTQVNVGGTGQGNGQRVAAFSATGTIRNILFDYGYGLGIDVNKSHASFMWNRCAYNDTNSLFYAEDVVVRDNWTYNHGNKSYEIAGKWAVVKGNIASRDFHRHNVSPYPNVTDAFNGYVNWSNGRYWTQESVDDHMSRAFDMAGANLWVDGNNYGPTGSNTANDGEGILWQPHNGVDMFSVAVTKNYKDNGPGDSGYIAPYDMDVVGLLQFENVNEKGGNTGIVQTGTHYLSDMSFVNNWNNVAKTIASTPAGVGLTGGATSPNMTDFLATCPSNLPLAPAVTTTYDMTAGVVVINWTDVTADEVGYRIDRKRPADADWTTIAYRPRQETPGTWFWPASTRGDYGPKPHGCGNITADFNPAEWRDYLTGGDTSFIYRVMAFNCPEDPATGDTASVRVPVLSLATAVVEVPKFSVYPNPAKDFVTLHFEGKGEGTAEVRILDMKGRVLDMKTYNTATCDYRLSTAGLAKGVYQLHYTAGPNRYKTRLVVE